MVAAGAIHIGLISGTSMDAIDAVAADFGSMPPRIAHALALPVPEELRERLRAIASPSWRGDLDELGGLDIETGELFAEAATRVLEESGLAASAIAAIGSHGQTIRHRPDGSPPFTIQIGDPARIAERTGIAVVADFRRRDIAAGGQGAPLVPAFHAAAMRSTAEERTILNLGGIANLTLLPSNHDLPVTGFDTGPANTLLDHWARLHLGCRFDDGGHLASQGTVIEELLREMEGESWFSRPPPKSTGPEHFGAEWLTGVMRGRGPYRPEDVQRTLVELTARTVAAATEEYAPQTEAIYACGGGVHNRLLMERIAAALPNINVASTAALGIDPDYMEALAFAWLASRTIAGLPGNLPAVTGAARPVILGAIYR